MDVLSDLTTRYEAVHHPIATADLSEGDMLGHLLEANGVTQAATARQTGIAESTISAVLSGNRRLTRDQIAKLAHYFHVEPGCFYRQ